MRADPMRSRFEWDISNVAWFAWFVGSALIALGWFRLVTPQVSWAGFYISGAAALVMWTRYPLGSARSGVPRSTASDPLSRAEALARRGRLDQAESIYQELLASDPGNVDALLGMARCRFKRGERDEAELLCRRATEAHPASAAAHESLGNIAAERGNHAAAERAYRRALELSPAAVYSHWGLAAMLTRSGDYGGALRHLDRVAELVPGTEIASQASSKAAEIRSGLKVG